MLVVQPFYFHILKNRIYICKTKISIYIFFYSLCPYIYLDIYHIICLLDFLTFVCWGSRFLLPLNVSTVSAGTAFFQPPCGPRKTVIVVVMFPFYLFLFNRGWFSGNRRSLHNDFFNFRHLLFPPQLFVEGLIFFIPWVCRPRQLDPFLFDPQRAR